MRGVPEIVRHARRGSHVERALLWFLFWPSCWRARLSSAQPTARTPAPNSASSSSDALYAGEVIAHAQDAPGTMSSWWMRVGIVGYLACIAPVLGLGSRLDQDQNATTLAKATAEAKLAASLS